MRQCSGKEKAIYIDFVDKSKFLKDASDARMETFREEGHEVKIEKYQDIKIEKFIKP